jgi:hypothetical protein
MKPATTKKQKITPRTVVACSAYAECSDRPAALAAVPPPTGVEPATAAAATLRAATPERRGEPGGSMLSCQTRRRAAAAAAVAAAAGCRAVGLSSRRLWWPHISGACSLPAAGRLVARRQGARPPQPTGCARFPLSAGWCVDVESIWPRPQHAPEKCVDPGDFRRQIVNTGSRSFSRDRTFTPVLWCNG